VPLLLVMGHAQCGGAAHSLQICRRKDFVPSNFIDRWCMMGRVLQSSTSLLNLSRFYH
jgi:hypothetical protein